MMQFLDELKDYLRIDGHDDDRSIQMFLNSAISYVENAGVKKPADPFEERDGIDIHAQYRLTVLLLATHWYENRIVITPTIAKVEQAPIPYGLESMLLQLKWTDAT